MTALCGHSWPGNVRELRNVIERLIIATAGDTIEPEAVPADIGPAAAADRAVRQTETLKEQKAAAERAIVLAALEHHQWHVTNTARDLGLADHSSLLKIMRRHGLKR